MIQPLTSTKVFLIQLGKYSFLILFSINSLNQLCKQNGSVLKILNTETMDQCTEIEITLLLK